MKRFQYSLTGLFAVLTAAAAFMAAIRLWGWFAAIGFSVVCGAGILPCTLLNRETRYKFSSQVRGVAWLLAFSAMPALLIWFVLAVRYADGERGIAMKVLITVACGVASLWLSSLVLLLTMVARRQ